MLTQSELKNRYSYNPETGIFTVFAVKKYSKYKIGQTLGYLHGGYLCIEINKKQYFLHRLAFLYITGQWPKHQIDHINMVRTDNRWSNLREATNSQNKMNNKLRPDNKTGYKGVDIHKQSGKFRAQAHFNKKVHYLGLFETAELASKAYIDFSSIHYGQFYSTK